MEPDASEMTPARLNAEIAKVIAETIKIGVESGKAIAETNKLAAEASKVAAESNKIMAETRWYPLVALGSVGLATVTAVVAIVKMILHG